MADDIVLERQEELAQTRFERFLEKKCFEENPQILDDDMPDFFADWLSNLDSEELVNYGNEAMSDRS